MQRAFDLSSPVPPDRDAHAGDLAAPDTLAQAEHAPDGTSARRVPLRPAEHGRHRRKGATARMGAHGRGLLSRHFVRFASFSAVGSLVFAGGLLLQVLLVQRWHFGAVVSYVLQGFVSIQASFLLNRSLTWRDRDTGFLAAWWKFNTSKIVTTIINFALYSGLILIRVNYLVANMALTALFTIANYVLGNSWAFAADKARHAATTSQAAAPDAGAKPAVSHPQSPAHSAPRNPTVSVVIPCKSNERTVRATVEALLKQDYPALVEVILVGSVGDSTWSALSGINDPRMILVEQQPIPGRRDPNIKRARGLSIARGELLALVDSDIVMGSNWLSRGIAELFEYGVDCVAGGMRSIHDTFWGRYVDGNRLGAKTPRIPSSYIVSAQKFGKAGQKPPITANAIFTRELYHGCPLNVSWTYGYEDYEWFWRIASKGYQTLVSDGLIGLHHHRRGLIPLAKEYLRSSEGCGIFVKTHPDCPLSRKRRCQVGIIPIGAVMLSLAGVLVAHWHELPPFFAGLGALPLAAGVWEFAKLRKLEAFLYPFVTLVVTTLFTYGLLRVLLTGKMEIPMPETDLAGDFVLEAVS